jgi:hypothetical protein
MFCLLAVTPQADTVQRSELVLAKDSRYEWRSAVGSVIKLHPIC